MDGQKLTGFELWETVAKIAVNEGFLRSLVHRCDCETGACSNVPINPIFGKEFNRCPYPLLRTGYWKATVFLYRASQVSALADYPQRYSVGIVHAIACLQDEIERKKVKELNRVKK